MRPSSSKPESPLPEAAATGDGDGSDLPAVTGTGGADTDTQVRALRAPRVGVDEGADAEIPFPLHQTPSDAEARTAGYADAEEWYCKSAAASITGPVAKRVEYQMLPPPEADEVDEVELEQDPGEGDEFPPRDGFSALLAPVIESYLSNAMGIERPFLMIDVEFRSAQRTDACLNIRGVLSKIAKEDWQRDTQSGVTLSPGLPPLMDGRNCRPLLRAAQLRSTTLYGIIIQLRSELSLSLIHI